MNVDPPAEKAVYSFRREWLKDFEWLCYEKALCSTHCIHFKACGMEFAGNSKERVPNTRNAGTSVCQNVQDHQVQSLRPLIIRIAHIGVCHNIVIVVLTMCNLTLSSILQKTNKTPTESACIHGVMESSRLN